MNVTLGLPRLIEIVDARRVPSTPIMELYVKSGHTDLERMRKIATEIEMTSLEDIASIETDLVNMRVLAYPGDPPRFHAVIVRICEDPHVHEVRLDRGDVLEGGHLDLGRDLSHPLEVRVTRLDVQLHDRGRRHATRVDDFDQPREPEGDVHLGDPRVVKSSHSHLGPGFPDRLRGHDPRRLVRVDRVEVKLLADSLEDLLEALLAELESMEFLR